MDTTSNNIPAFTMSFILIYPLEKTMAFGGVAIGNMKPILAASVTGIANKMGLIAISSEIPKITGTKIWTSATLLMN